MSVIHAWIGLSATALTAAFRFSVMLKHYCGSLVLQEPDPNVTRNGAVSVCDDTINAIHEPVDLEKVPVSTQVRRGVGPWEGEWPVGNHFDTELLAEGDYRNVEDHYRYWKREAIAADIQGHSLGFEVAIENLGHDFNIGSIVRTANALGASRIHIVGRRRWNRRGAMVTDKYMDVVHHMQVSEFASDVLGRGLSVIGVDNLSGSSPLERAELPARSVLVFGEEGAGLSEEMLAQCESVLHITQYGSTRSLNVGHAGAIAMWAWVIQNGPLSPKGSNSP